MKLRDVNLVPGSVLDGADPDRLGRVKAEAPGLFPGDDPEKLPWIYPLTNSACSSIRTMRKGDRIWILDNTANYAEFWYIPFFELSDNAREVLNDYAGSEVMLSRKGSSGDVTAMYYSEDAGLNIESGGSGIKCSNSGDVSINAGTGKELLLESDSASLGMSGGSYQEAVLGQRLKDLLDRLASDLRTMSSQASSCPYTAVLAAPLMTTASNISGALSSILSDNVKIN